MASLMSQSYNPYCNDCTFDCFGSLMVLSMHELCQIDVYRGSLCPRPPCLVFYMESSHYPDALDAPNRRNNWATGHYGRVELHGESFSRLHTLHLAIYCCPLWPSPCTSYIGCHDCGWRYYRGYTSVINTVISSRDAECLAIDIEQLHL